MILFQHQAGPQWSYHVVWCMGVWRHSAVLLASYCWVYLRCSVWTGSGHMHRQAARSVLSPADLISTPQFFSSPFLLPLRLSLLSPFLHPFSHSYSHSLSPFPFPLRRFAQAPPNLSSVAWRSLLAPSWVKMMLRWIFSALTCRRQIKLLASLARSSSYSLLSTYVSYIYFLRYSFFSLPSLFAFLCFN